MQSLQAKPGLQPKVDIQSYTLFKQSIEQGTLGQQETSVRDMFQYLSSLEK